MTDYDYTSWQFLDAIGQASPLQDEALSLAFEFPSSSTGNGPLSSDNCPAYGQTSAKQGYMHTHLHSHSPPIELGMEMETEMFAQGMEFISIPPFPDLNHTLGHSNGHGKKTPDTHTHTHTDLSLLRSTSFNAAAAERALFMTPSPSSSPSSSSSSSSSNQHSSPSLDLDPCTPSTTSTSSKESEEDCVSEWDHPTSQSLNFYKLPERLSLDSSFPAVSRPSRTPHHRHYRVNHRDSEGDEANANAEELTPLEMPDGTTRFTANWLPVDPTGGFIIGIEEGSASVSASASGVEYSYAYRHGHGHGEQDHAYGYGYADPVSVELEFSKEAFIQMPAPV